MNGINFVCLHVTAKTVLTELMKKLLIIGGVALSMLFWTCSTEIDVLDDWKETTIVYGLLDQSQPKQYIRIQKAFLGPDNALTMAQQFDSINYINQLDVKIEALNGGSVVQTFSLQPDTVPKDYGMFAGPNQVVYSFDTPQGTLNSNYQYKLTVSNSATGHSVTAITDLVESSSSGVFVITTPSTSNSTVSFEPTTTAPDFSIKWKAAPTARIYQPAILLHYTEFYVNGDSAHTVTPEWVLDVVKTNDVTATSDQEVKIDKMSFYRFLGENIAVNANVVRRRADYLELNIYAANDEMKNYIEINGASNSISQEHPIYTNIDGGYGIFAARTHAVKPTNGGQYTWPLSQRSIDGNSSGFKGLVSTPETCELKFEKWDHSSVPGCI
jgi:hypothetical protein